MAIGSLDFSNMNFDFGSMDFGGLAQFSLPPTFSLFTPEQAQTLQQTFASGQPLIPFPNPPSAVTGQVNITGLSVPIVRPPLPKPDDLSGTKPIPINPDRYRIDKTGWSVSSSPSVAPLSFPFGTRPKDIIPVLRAKGIVVKISMPTGDKYLISPQTLSDITKSGNPHYDMVENGMILDTPIGRTVPVIELDMKAVDTLITQQDSENRYAGVKDVKYITETVEQIDGLPAGLVDQINFTIDKATSRPADEFDVWNLTLSGKYEIKSFVVVTNQEDGKLDKKKLSEFLKGMKERQKEYQDDLNFIKGIFYEGKADGAKTWNNYTQVANDKAPLPKDSNWVKKETEGVKNVDNAAETAKDAASKATDELINPPTDLSWTGDLRKVNATWAAYGFTTAEADSLKRPQPAGTLLITPKGVPNAINIAINWNPSVCTKARIVANIPETIPADTGRNPIAKQLIEYIGKLNPMASDADWKQYITINNNKKAELLHIARLIRDEERTNSKAQATGGGTTGGGNRDQTGRAAGNNVNLNDEVAGDRGRARFE